MQKLYLHPADRRDGALPGTILATDRPEDGSGGIALVRVDPYALGMKDAEADDLAAEICRRFNAANKPAATMQTTGPAIVNYAPLRRTEADADAPDFAMQAPWIDNITDRMAWVKSTRDAFERDGAVEIRTSLDRHREPTLMLMEGWVAIPKAPPPPRFMPVPSQAK